MPLEDLLRQRFANFRAHVPPRWPCSSATASTCCPLASARTSPSGSAARTIPSSTGCWPPLVTCGQPPVRSRRNLIMRSAEMYRVGITADLNDEDHTGYVWTFLDEARDPAQVTPGAIVIVGDEENACRPSARSSTLPPPETAPSSTSGRCPDSSRTTRPSSNDPSPANTSGANREARAPAHRRRMPQSRNGLARAVARPMPPDQRKACRPVGERPAVGTSPTLGGIWCLLPSRARPRAEVTFLRSSAVTGSSRARGRRYRLYCRTRGNVS